MWELGEGNAKLIQHDYFPGFKVDGTPYTIDLINRTKNEGISTGDIIVRFHRELNAIEREPFDWSFEIDAIGGGIIETSNAIMYRAPIEGYSESYKLEISKEDPDWTCDIRGKKFYIKSRGGDVYTAMRMNIIAHYNYGQTGAVLRMEWVTNGEGSTNLEPKK